MAILVKHNKVSTVPDTSDTSLVRPSDWNADHTLTGFGTAAELNAGVANGVATLDSSGKVPTSQIPLQGDLNYQGAWNASTNTPTLASGTGTKGYYYVVSVAGTTNLDGITDWQVGDWAIFNGTVWQKVDNTDAVTSVNGYTGAVVLTQPDIAGTANSGTNTNITSMTGITGGISTADYVGFDTTYSTALTAGQLGWDGNNTLALGMAGGNVIQHIGEDSFFYIKASSAITKGQLVMFTGAVGASGVLTGAPSTGVTNPQYIMGVAAESIALNDFGLVQWFGEITGINTNGFNEGDILYYDSAVTGGLTNVYPTSGIIVTVAAVAKKSAGGGVLYVRVSVTDRISASTGISVNQATTGVTVTNTAPDQTVAIASGTGISVTGTYPNFTVTNTAPSSGGTVTSVSGTAPIASTGGTTPTISISQASSTTNGYLSSTDWNTFNNKGSGTVTSVAMSVPTGLSVSGSPITGSGTLSVTYSAGYSIPTTASQANWDTAYSERQQWNGGSTNLVAATGRTSLGATTVGSNFFTLTNPSAVTFPRMNADNTVSALDAATFRSAIGAGTGNGTVTSVSGTAPISSTGGTTPAISISQATTSTNGYLSSTDWNTFNGKQAALVSGTNIKTVNSSSLLGSGNLAVGTVTSVAATAGTGISISGSPITSSGTLTITNTGVTSVNGSTGAVTVSGGQFFGTAATKAIAYNANSISENITVTAGNNGLSAGPITVNTGYTVTVETGAVWVIV